MSWFKLELHLLITSQALNVSTGRYNGDLSERDALNQVREMAVRLLEDEDVVILMGICKRVREIQPLALMISQNSRFSLSRDQTHLLF